jgi:hypothetical protein
VELVLPALASGNIDDLEAHALAAIALQVRQSLWRSSRVDPLNHHGALNRAEEDDDLAKHRQTPNDRIGFCALVRSV